MAKDLLAELQGDPHLDTTITVKIASDTKEDLIEFCKVHKISMGKVVRKGIEMVRKEIEK